METKTTELKEIVRQLKLTGMGLSFEQLILDAQQKQVSYLDFAYSLMDAEIRHRNEKHLALRMKTAKLPDNHDLNSWQEIHGNGLAKQQLAQLRECFWLEQNFNIVLMGPSGTGKTFVAAGLCFEALKMGYRACFRTMDQLNYILKMKDFIKTMAREYATIQKSNLLVIDDIMMFPIERKQAVAMFNLIDFLHQKASIIVTTNKSPEEWVKILDDEVLATAILDRLLAKCEVIRLSGKSFRIQNRKSIFANAL